MNINDRVVLVRKELKMTQETFAKEIGIARTTLAGYVCGKSEPSTPVLAAICAKFNVDRHWLETGEGNMFTIDALSLDAVADRYGATPIQKEIASLFLKLDPVAREAVIEYIMSLPRKPRA